MTTTVLITVGLLFAAALYGSLTIYGLRTGRMWALSNVAERDKDPDWFWGWAVINGGTAAISALGFLLMLTVNVFGRP